MPQVQSKLRDFASPSCLRFEFGTIKLPKVQIGTLACRKCRLENGTQSQTMRLGIGFVIGSAHLPVSSRAQGLIFGVLLSLPPTPSSPKPLRQSLSWAPSVERPHCRQVGRLSQRGHLSMLLRKTSSEFVILTQIAGVLKRRCSIQRYAVWFVLACSDLFALLNSPAVDFSKSSR